MPTESLAARRPATGRPQVDAPAEPVIRAPTDVRAASRPSVDAGWCLAGLGLVAAYVAWAIGVRLAWWTTSLSTTGVIVNGSVVALYGVTAVLQWRAAHSPHLDASTRSAWLLMFATNFGAFALSGTGAVRALFGMNSAGGLAWQAAQPIIFVSTNALAFLALSRFPVPAKSRTERATFWLDAGTVGTAAMLLAWHLLFRDAIAHTHGGALQAAEALGYPASDVMLLFATLALLLRRPLRSSATALRVFAVGSALSVAADVPTVFDVLADGAAKAEPYFILYVVAAWLFGVAGYVQTRNAARDAALPPANPATADLSVSVLPYIAVALVYASLAIEARRVVNVAAVGASHGPGSALLVLVAGAAVVTGFVIARQVVAVRRNAELVADRLARESYFRAVIERSSDMFVVVERDGRVREASPAFARAAGTAPAALRGASFLDCIHPADREAVRADLAVMAHATAEPAPFEWRVHRGPAESAGPPHDDAASHRWIEVVCTNLLEDPAVGALVLNGRDVSDRKQLELELLHRADHDALTGLVNARTFLCHLERVVDRPAPAQQGFALMYVDLDAFKPINDRHGHAAGDAVLRAVSDRLRSATRGSDVVARLGGDEFAVYLDAVTACASVELVANRVLAAMHQPIRLVYSYDGDVSVGCSIGIVIAAAGVAPASAGVLLHRADSAMYAAKESGGGRYAYAPLLHQDHVERG